MLAVKLCAQRAKVHIRPLAIGTTLVALEIRQRDQALNISCSSCSVDTDNETSKRGNEKEDAKAVSAMAIGVCRPMAMLVTLQLCVGS